MTNHGRQRGGFARAGGAHEDDDAALGHCQFFDDFRQFEVIDFRDIGFNRIFTTWTVIWRFVELSLTTKSKRL